MMKRPKRKITRKAKPITPRAATIANRAAQWKAFRELQTQADRAWKKIHADVRRRAPQNIILRDQKHLLLLLGECNYMARECMRLNDRQKRR